MYITASDFTSITSHIHSWALFLLWFRLFILSGVISPLISSSILGTYRPEEFIFQCHIFLPFHNVHGGLAYPTAGRTTNPEINDLCVFLGSVDSWAGRSAAKKRWSCGEGGVHFLQSFKKRARERHTLRCSWDPEQQLEVMTLVSRAPGGEQKAGNHSSPCGFLFSL